MIAARTWLTSYDRTWLRADVAAGITPGVSSWRPSVIRRRWAAAEAGSTPALAGSCSDVLQLAPGLHHHHLGCRCSSAPLLAESRAATRAPSALAACTLLVAALAFVAYAVRAGPSSTFPETVLVAFKCIVALFLASTQLPKLFGLSGSHGDFWERMGTFFRDLAKPTRHLTLGLIALSFLLLGKTPEEPPVALFVVIGGIVAARVLHLDNRGVALLGEVPQGLPMPTLPMVSAADVHEIVPLAMACFMLAAVETTAIGRMFAAKHGYRLDATQEFLAIGSANLMAGLGSGLPVSGGMSQSLVNETAGARSPLSGLVAAIITLGVVLFFTGLLRTAPATGLAAALMAVTG